MSWLSKSLTGLLQSESRDNEGSDSWGEADEIFSPKSVKDDLSELGKSLSQHLRGVASFLAPPPSPETHDLEEGFQAIDTNSGNADQTLPEINDGYSASPHKLSGLQSDLAELKGGFAKGLSRLSSVIRAVAKDEFSSDERNLGERAESTEAESADKKPSSSLRFPAKIANHIDEISKLASSFLPFVHEDEGAPGITEEVVAFGRSISLHPETWLDFPALENRDDFEMNSSQMEHIDAIEYAAPGLAALKVELCPQHMSEENFWKIYFVLLHSRLSEEDAALLSTPQVLKARKVLLEDLREGTSKQHDEVDEVVEVDGASGVAVVDKAAIESTVKLATVESEEKEADEWLEDSDGRNAGVVVTEGGGVDEDDDVSFSDLEEEDIQMKRSEVEQQQQQQQQQQHEKKKHHERMGSSDWLTVNKEDVGSSQ